MFSSRGTTSLAITLRPAGRCDCRGMETFAGTLDEGKIMSGLFSRILVAVDGSEPAKIAAAVAARLAREHGGELSLCFCPNWKPLIAQFESIGAVVDPTPTIDALKERGRQLLTEATAIAARIGVEARSRTAAGDPAITIPALAHELASTLIVMGTHDGAGVQRLLVGSMTNAVRAAARSRC
jgi:nucleotide-binding universal stress UspA family protein